MARMTGGRAVLESLKAQGVDLLFGIISVHNLDLYDALYDDQDSIRYVGGRLELACGYMADGYARASGRQGVFVTSTGPGAAGSMGSLGEAYHSGSPVLEITTNVEREFINSGRGADPRAQGPAWHVPLRHRLECPYHQYRVHPRSYTGGLPALPDPQAQTHRA